MRNLMDDWALVVGVVADHRRLGLQTDAGPEFYLPAEQFGIRGGQLFVRTSVEPISLASAVRQSVRELDPGLPVQQLQTMEQLLSSRLAPRYYSMLLLSLFALIALLLAAVGIYGVLSYQVRQRTHEFGIRMALGARPGDIIVLILKRGLVLAVVGLAIGLAIGLAGAMALARFASGLLHGVSGFDLTNLVTVSLVLLGTTVLASYLAARRATTVEPAVALRYE